MLTGPGSEGRIALLNLETREEVPLIPLGSQPRYAATGHIVYGTEGTLRAVPFDLARLTVTGDPVPVLEDVVTKATGAVDFGLAEDGSLVYVTGAAGAAGGRSLMWVNREGREEAVSAAPRAYVYPRISPDGTRVAADIRDQEQDIWIWDFAGEVLTRFTFDPAPDFYPVWTPDGLRVAFSSLREGRTFNLFWKAADGTGTVERLTDSPNTQFSYAFSPDGEQLLFREIVPDTGQDLRVLSLDDARTVTPLVATAFDDRNAELSPDGHWLAYESNAAGQFEIYVRPFPDVDSGRWQVSRAGGIQPAWGPDGQELFYLDPARSLVAVRVRGAGATFTRGNPEVLFEAQGYFTTGPVGRTYDVSPDGERFLLIKTGTTDETGARPDIILIQNWFEELNRLVPVN